MKLSLFSISLLICWARAQYPSIEGQELPVLADYQALRDFARENQDTALSPLDNGMAMFRGDVPIAVAGPELVVEVMPELVRLSTEEPESNETPGNTQISRRRNVLLDKRACSRLPCFQTVTCYASTDCHVCIKNMHTRGYCI